MTELDRGRPWWRQRWLVLVLGYALAYGVGVAYAALLSRSPDWNHGLAWEVRVMYALHVPLPRALDYVLLAVPWEGTNLTLMPVVVPAAIWLWWKRHRADLAMRLAIVQLGSWTLNPALKYTFDRARPTLFERRGWYGMSSYPIGHAIAGVAVLLTIGLMLHREQRVWWPFALLLAITLLNAWSRVYLGVHWLTDVIGGLIVGLLWLVTTAYAFRGDEASGAGRLNEIRTR